MMVVDTTVWIDLLGTNSQSIQRKLSAHSNSEGMGALDTFIAAQALSLGATLVTSTTREFATVPGLQIEDWR